MKICFLDTETTGLDPNRHAIIEVGYIIDYVMGSNNVDTRHEDCFKMRPHDGAEISQGAIDVHGYSEDELKAFPSPDIQHANFTRTLSRFVDKFNRRDKLYFVGYNAGFDLSMMYSWFRAVGDNYCGSWFFSPPIDVATIVALNSFDCRPKMPNFRLETVARHEGIIKDGDDVKFHSALDDVRVTRALFYKHFWPIMQGLAKTWPKPE